MDRLIGGLFGVESDRDGTYYKVTFKPDKSQIWSDKLDGFAVTLFSEGETKELVGEHRDAELAQARIDGGVTFHGKVSGDLYWKYAERAIV